MTSVERPSPPRRPWKPTGSHTQVTQPKRPPKPWLPNSRSQTGSSCWRGSTVPVMMLHNLLNGGGGRPLSHITHSLLLASKPLKRMPLRHSRRATASLTFPSPLTPAVKLFTRHSTTTPLCFSIGTNHKKCLSTSAESLALTVGAWMSQKENIYMHELRGIFVFYLLWKYWKLEKNLKTHKYIKSFFPQAKAFLWMKLCFLLNKKYYKVFILILHVWKAAKLPDAANSVWIHTFSPTVRERW